MDIMDQLCINQLMMFKTEILYYRAVGLDYGEIAQALYDQLALSYPEAAYLREHGAELFDYKEETNE